MTAAVLTVSDKGSRGQRVDTAGPAVRALLEENGYTVVHTEILPDEAAQIREMLIDLCDRRDVALVVTVGGTGFSQRDVTPEATRSVMQREAPGIAEAMRAASLQITPMAMLSRGVAGLRGRSLIINLPGSEKAARENLTAVIGPLEHGLTVLRGRPVDCAGQTGVVEAVCISGKKGEVKRPIPAAVCRENHGIVGDAHAGPWHRQVSLLARESVEKMEKKLGISLKPGDFAENILTRGIPVASLPVGARVRIGTALGQVTQIGKECHADCAIRRQTGDCVMPREGIFLRILQSGEIRPGDSITVLPEEPDAGQD